MFVILAKAGIHSFNPGFPIKTLGNDGLVNGTEK